MSTLPKQVRFEFYPHLNTSPTYNNILPKQASVNEAKN